MKQSDMDDGKFISMFFNTQDIRRFLCGHMQKQLKRKIEETSFNACFNTREG